MKKTVYALACAMLLASSAAAEETVIYGAVGGYYPGIYKTTPSTAASPEKIFEYNGINPANTGGVFAQNMFLYVDWDSSSSYSKPTLKRYSHNGEFAEWTNLPWVESLPVTSAHTALALDPVSENVYGCFYNTDKTTFFFGTLDVNTGLSTKIAELSSRLNSMAFDDNGVLYAITSAGKLLKGGTTGTFEEVAELSTRPSAKKASGAAIASDGTFYLSLYDSNMDYSFNTVDLTSGTVTNLATLSSSTLMPVMYIPAAAPAATAPAGIADLDVSAEGFSTELNISFTVPSTTVGGDAIMAGLRAYVLLDGAYIADGEIVGPGTAYSKTLDVEPGMHTVLAFVRNYAATETSPKSKVSLFVGEDLAAAPADLEAEKTDNGVLLTWTAPEKGISGGDFDASQLTYTVKLMPGGTVVAEGLEETEYLYPVTSSALQMLQFEVASVTSRGEGGNAVTAKVLVGDGKSVPYSENFDDAGSLDDTFFTILDANNDNKAWELNTQKLKLGYNSSKAADDWAITPPVILRKDHEYKLSFVYSVNKWPTDRLEVKIGTEPTVDAMTGTVMAAKDYPANNNTPDEVTFEVETSGVYYIGFHALNDKDTYYVYLDDISLDYADEAHAEPSAAPAAAEDLTAVPNDDMTSVKVSFKVPSTDVEGGNHPDVDRAELFYNDNLLKTYKFVDSGAEYTLDHNDLEGDNHSYYVVMHNAAGSTKSAVVTAGQVTGVNALQAEGEEPVKWYNMQGIEIPAPVKGEPAIKVSGAKSEITVR